MRVARFLGLAVALVVLFIGGYLFSSCGFDNTYRYPCQDPTNWTTKACTPPECEPTGNCSQDLVWGTQDGS